MVQSSVRAAHVNSYKSSRQEDVMSIRVRGGRGQHNSDPIQCQEASPASDSHIGLHDSTQTGTRARHRTVPGEPHSSHQTQKPLRKTPSSARRKTPSSARRTTPSSVIRKTPSAAKTRVKVSPKMDGHRNLQPEKNIDYLDRATVLLDWIIKPLPDIRGVCVEGQKLGMDDYWHSAAIVEAVRPTVVVTATGSMYRLEGQINKYCTIDNGFPKGVAKLFTNGFPHNWKQVIKDFYSRLEDSISIVAETSPLKHKKLQHNPKLVATVSKKKTPAVPSRKLKTLDRVQDSIWTPAGFLKQKLSTDDVTVTRSGRISLPPLARWTGQCYRRVPNSSDIEVTFETDCAKRSLHNTTAQLLQLPKKYRSTSSSVDSDSAVLQSADSSVNKSRSRPVRAAQASKQLQADNSGSRLQEPADSSSADIQNTHCHRQTKVAKTTRKQTGKKKSPTGQKSVRSDHKTSSQPLAEAERLCLKAEGKPAALGKAVKPRQRSTSNQSAVDVGLIEPPAAAKRKQVCTIRKRKLDADDDAAKEGNNTIVERKPNKRRKVMDVTSAGDVSWSQEEQALLHRALREVSGADSSYWHKVSLIVSTRSQTECQQFYRQYLEVKGSKKPSKASSTSQKQKGKA
ncbi:unnamed protein product, partial [Candidula unifasciata]